jgi:Clp amino terminal domain, pathogenicity island component
MLALVFERFTERARQVVVLAQEEARTLKHNYIGTEHILLGLLREEEGLAARVLESLDITVERVREQVVRIADSGEEVASGQIPVSPRAKKVLELALREALSLGHDYIDTEHLLLGLVREKDGVGARILLDFNADSEKIRNELIPLLTTGEGGPDSPRSLPILEIGRIEVRFSARVRRFLMAAAARSLDRGDTEVDLADLLSAIADDESAVSALEGLLGNRPDEGPEPGSEEG